MRAPRPADLLSPDFGPFRRAVWRSPLRGPWLTSLLGSALLVAVAVTALTGFASHLAYNPSLGDNAIFSGPLALGFSDWPTEPPWIYAVTQSLHVIAGLAAIPLLLAKLWSVIPKLFEVPALRSPAHAAERASLALLVGGSLFVFFTGVLNIQLYYPWGFNFIAAHYYGALLFLGALALHLVVKIPLVRRTLRADGIRGPLRRTRAATRAEPASASRTVATEPAEPTISRRGLLAWVGGASVGLGLMGAAQSIGGPLRSLGLLVPHGQDAGSGPNGFQVNKTAAARGIDPARTGPSWRLALGGERELSLSREELLALPQRTERLPIACVEGWTTTQDWTGVPLRDLAELAGLDEPAAVLVTSLQEGGSFDSATLGSGQVADRRSLLALRVNGADLSLDHGFPARVIVPAAPGVHCTKWVSGLSFEVA